MSFYEKKIHFNVNFNSRSQIIIGDEDLIVYYDFNGSKPIN